MHRRRRRPRHLVGPLLAPAALLAPNAAARFPQSPPVLGGGFRPAAAPPPVASAGPWNFEVGELTLQMRKDYLDLVNRRLSNS